MSRTEDARALMQVADPLRGMDEAETRYSASFDEIFRAVVADDDDGRRAAFMPHVPETGPHADSSSSPSPTPVDFVTPVRRRQLLPALLGVAAVVIVGLVAALVVSLDRTSAPVPPGQHGSASSTTSDRQDSARLIVPNVGGLTAAEANRTLNSAGFTSITIRQVADANVPAGQIISSSPAAGSTFPAGQSIVVLVSSGPDGAVSSSTDPSQNSAASGQASKAAGAAACVAELNNDLDLMWTAYRAATNSDPDAAAELALQNATGNDPANWLYARAESIWSDNKTAILAGGLNNQVIQPTIATACVTD